MTTPDVPYRVEFTVEVPGTADQVWAAIATTDGISSWFLPTDVEEREGGSVVTHMGETDSPGSVTGWDPPRRFALEEPGWASLAGHDGAPVTPLATEFLVEARSGGSCVVRVVSSAFGTGADWEREFIDSMETHWAPFFELLRIYLDQFAGRRATSHTVEVEVPGTAEGVRAAVARALGVSDVGQPVAALGLAGRVERLGEPYLFLSVAEPAPGYISVFVWDGDGDMATAQLTAWLFGDEAPSFVERAAPGWRAWLQALTVDEAAAAPPSRR